ncbi:hypothetical protein GWK47_023925 [Chionoecetes opilio]|uniref:Uncharacterized protein n=1 Tax=Chionoecetes opilio TaxID=41210 RepID=A0A8J5BTM2_CHIOP|nr:hypothetical protein GWK47_023925 [Chionoecetes opilio]
MSRKKLSMEEKTRALTLLEQGMSSICVAAEMKVSRQAIYLLKRSAAILQPSMTPKRNEGSGGKRKTSPRTDKILKREVKSDPSITGSELKKKHQELLQDIAIRTIQHRAGKRKEKVQNENEDGSVCQHQNDAEGMGELTSKMPLSFATSGGRRIHDEEEEEEEEEAEELEDKEGKEHIDEEEEEEEEAEELEDKEHIDEEEEEEEDMEQEKEQKKKRSRSCHPPFRQAWELTVFFRKAQVRQMTAGFYSKVLSGGWPLEPPPPPPLNVSETIKHFLLQCPRFHSHLVVLRSQLLNLNVTTFDLPTLLAAAGLPPGGSFFFLNVSETIEHFLLQCPRFHSHRVVLRSQLLTLNVATCDLPTLLAAAGVHPSRQHAVIRLTCAFLRKTGQLQRL